MINIPFFSKKNINKNNLKPLVLLVLDGFGIAPPSEGNGITLAKTPNYNHYLTNYPHTELIASGESVGLPANEVGNTEVGHLTLGAGRVIYQDLKRINYAINNGTFFDKPAFIQATAHVKKNNSKLHILGLVSSGNVHSSIEHLFALMQFCKKDNLKNVYLHLFTDGRDAPPKEGIEIIKKVEEEIKAIKICQIATICGRYYAMDRDRRWDRTQKAYDLIVMGKGIASTSAEQSIQDAYSKGQTDEFIEPRVIVKDGKPIATVDDNDSVIFFNFRVDRPKQLTIAFIIKNFESLRSFNFGYNPETSRNEGMVNFSSTFIREKKPNNIFFVTMTDYQKNLPVSAVAFGPEVIEKPLSLVLSEAKFKQMHMAESEKERFVTYYFDGLREKPLDGAEFKIVQSPKVTTYDKKPEMSLPKLVDEFIKELNKCLYKFFIINFANPDMVAHTGDIKATINAIEYVDKYMNDLVQAVLAFNGAVIIVGDHGNAEELLSYPTQTFFYTTSQGTVNTDHSNNPVPFVCICGNYAGNAKKLSKGALSDVAPTILKFMELTVPDVMTGRDLLSEVNNKTDNSQPQSDNLLEDQIATLK